MNDAIPIALIVNIVRITVTAILTMWAGPDNYAVQKICHDYAGYVIMMPLALAGIGVVTVAFASVALAASNAYAEQCT